MTAETLHEIERIKTHRRSLAKKRSVASRWSEKGRHSPNPINALRVCDALRLGSQSRGNSNLGFAKLKTPTRQRYSP